MNVRTMLLRTLLGGNALSALMGKAVAVQLLLQDLEAHLAETGDQKALRLVLRLHRLLESVVKDQGATVGMDVSAFSGTGPKPE
jgi:hypothetical protein